MTAVRWMAILGPTGSGKSALGLAVAAALDGEIISCDSVQLYRGFDIGAAKPTSRERQLVRHHLIDCFDWQHDCDAAQYAVQARQAIEDVCSRGRLPIVVGGTGLYFRALIAEAFHDQLPKDDALRARLKQQDAATLYDQLKRIDPKRAGQLHVNDRVRVVRALELSLLLNRPVSEVLQATGEEETAWRRECYLVILDPDRAQLHAAIASRTQSMINQGLLAEVRYLLATGVNPACKPMQSIGYKQALEVLSSNQLATALAPAIDAATRQYAKRQSTWFRKVRADERLTVWERQGVIATVSTVFRRLASPCPDFAPDV